MIIFDIETTGLNPFQNQILTIQIKRGGEIKIWKVWEENGEFAVIEKFLDFVEKSDEPIIGYNILKFDLRFILARLLINDRLDDNVQNMLKSKRWVDLLQFQHNGVKGLNSWAESLGIDKSSKVKGWHIPALYELGKYDEIVEHAIDDLNVCEKIVEKLGLEENF